MIKVLLIGPLDPEIPKGDLKLLTGGETTYVRTLLSNPPKGVLYSHWSDALEKRQIEFLFLHRILSILVKLRILPISSGTFCIRLKGDFDLVHSHSNSLKIVGKNIPVVISDSSSNYLFLRDYINWSEWRISIGYFLRRNLFKVLEVIDADTNLENAKKLIVFSNFAKRVHLKLGAPKERTLVVRPGILDPGKKKKKLKEKELHILFVGIWFERKGGRLVVEAFNKLSQKYQNIKLTIIGPVPKDIHLDKNRVEQVDFVPREKLLSQYFPKADIFVLVPLKAEGLGFVILEAASFGIPSIVSNVYALGEIVENGKTGFVVKKANVAELQEKIELLIRNKKMREKMGLSARLKFEKDFLVDVMNERLLKIYKEVV